MSTLTLNNIITIPDAPAISGLAFRRFRGEEDFPKMASVINDASRGDQHERVATVDEIRNSYSTLTNCDPERDMVMIEVNGELVGYSRVTWWDEASGTRIFTLIGFLSPQWRGKRIGRAVLRRNMSYVREMSVAQTEFTGPRFYEAGSELIDGPMDRLLVREGFTLAARFAMMVRPDLENIPEPVLPDGFEVRPVQQEHLRAIWEADWEASQDHFGARKERTEEAYQEWLGQKWFDPSMWKIAWHIGDNRVAGQVKSFINEAENETFKRKRGWTEDISVGRDYRRRGIARALLLMSLHELKARRMEDAALGVHMDNPNKAYVLYESVGFKVVRYESNYRKPIE